jgi:outer membrane murein-binding lipoprotein Lpp
MNKGTEDMNGEDANRLHQRIDNMSESFSNQIGQASKKFEEASSKIFAAVNDVASDVKVIKSTCKTRGETCARQVQELDKTVRGNGHKGVLVRVESLEEKDRWKGKLIFAVIGCVLTIISGIVILLVVNIPRT